MMKKLILRDAVCFVTVKFCYLQSELAKRNFSYVSFSLVRGSFLPSSGHKCLLQPWVFVIFQHLHQT